MTPTVRDLLGIGLSVIPVRPQLKTPILPWKVYQERYPTSEEIDKWSKRYGSCNWAVVTGTLSGVVVFDLDPGFEPERFDRYITTSGLLSPTWVTRTPRGYHIWFRHPRTRVIGNRAHIFPGVDIRGDGGYVIVPPSILDAGRPYSWVASPLDTPLLDLPGDLGI